MYVSSVGVAEFTIALNFPNSNELILILFNIKATIGKGNISWVKNLTCSITGMKMVGSITSLAI